MSYPRSIGQDKRGQPVLKMGAAGRRDGELDNELLEATQKIVGRFYRGEAKLDSVSDDRADSRLFFRISQEAARRRGILVPRFWWRQDAEVALAAWQKKHSSSLVTLGDLADSGIIAPFEGHGSPPADARATGRIPYVKVTDLKNWRVNENPTNFVHEAVANKLKKRGADLQYGDLLTPARASSNIGQFSLVLPWQTNVLLTREVLGLRVLPNDRGISSYLLLALLSLRVVQDQFKTLALMQTNREHLGDHWREVIIPLPDIDSDRLKIEAPVRAYFESTVIARQSWNTLTEIFDAEAFGTSP